MGSTESNKMEFDFASTAHDDVLLPMSSTSSSLIRDVSYRFSLSLQINILDFRL